MRTQPIIKVEKLHKWYGEEGETRIHVLRGVDLSIYRGETVVLLGKSGAGKSTLLHLLGGLDKPSMGSIFVKNRELNLMNETELSELRSNFVSYIFQFHYLLPEFTVLENVMIPLLIKEYKPSRSYKKALELLDILNIRDKINYKIQFLSGGESQRVAIARALVNEPEIILADEPTGNLDPDTSKIVTEYLISLSRKKNTTLVIVTHNSELVKSADRGLKIINGKIESLT